MLKNENGLLQENGCLLCIRNAVNYNKKLNISCLLVNVCDVPCLLVCTNSRPYPDKRSKDIAL